MFAPVLAAAITFWPGSVEKPPTEYIGAQHSAKVEQYATSEEVDKRCRYINGEIPRGRLYLACYAPLYNTIVVPVQNGDRVAEALYIHEAAHAAGWRHNHKDW